jgi:protein subunit release factor A
MNRNNTRVIEIRAGLGGEDARRFVVELAEAYLKTAFRLG